MQRKKVLITGITGFAGSHLAELLVSNGSSSVFGTHVSDSHLTNISGVKEKITLRKVNLNDRDAVFTLIHDIKPDIIYHLAASTNVGESFKKPADVITNNITSQVHILEGIAAQKIAAEKIIIISSCHVYGYVTPSDLPLTEETAFKPDNPYSVSKIAQDYLGYMYFLSQKLPVIRLRPCNHIGPRLSPGISISRFAKIIAEIEKGQKPPVLTVGNLAAKRDFTDVRDMVHAYELAAEKCDPGEVYNIGTGISFSIKEMLEKLLAFADIKITVETDPSLLRPSDIPELLVNAAKFTKKTGWKPHIPIEKTLRDTLDYWRKVI